jgi:hypothetical protein
MPRILQAALTISLLIVAAPGCAVPGAATPAPTPDNQATISAAVAATGTAQAGIEATIDAGVQGTTKAAAVATSTVQAMASPTAGVPPAMVTINPTPTPADYYALTEEELAALIDQAVTEAAYATAQASVASEGASGDDSLSAEEAAMMELYVTAAESAIAYTDELIGVYYDMYGELAEETLDLLVEVEDDLEVMASSVDVIATTLEENGEMIEQGLDLAEGTIDGVTDAAQLAQDRAGQARDRAGKWQTQLGDEINRRAAIMRDVKPNLIAPDKQGAILMTFDFLDQTRRALDDNKLSRAELTNIAQLGANVGASLSTHGGPALQQMPDRVNKITTHVARGEMPQARNGVTELNRDMGARPELPQPGGDRPGGGDRGGGDRGGGNRPGRK